ncbi:endoribonuclease xendoU domain-containing protein [Ditylenchus destructor]|uniref:Endoribonuclease xendoU domain-containing protein n=1 Tax=Ditylenchus destructor TaxID=166010 RepID=A0AAD4R6F1_9BILA|nr:endoribonuclease xendoU domain-containing protein [Ditylenchus destructor]
MRPHRKYLLCFLTIATSAHFTYTDNKVPVWRRKDATGAPTREGQPIGQTKKRPADDGVVKPMGQTNGQSNETIKKRLAESPPPAPEQKRRFVIHRQVLQTVNPTSAEGMRNQKPGNLTTWSKKLKPPWRKLNGSWRAGNDSSSIDPGLIKGIDWTYNKELDDLFMRMLQADEESPWPWNAKKPLIEYNFYGKRESITLGTPLFKKVDEKLFEKAQYQKMKEILTNYNQLFQPWICEEEKPNKERENKLDEFWKIMLDNKVFQIGLNYLADKLNVPRKSDGKNSSKQASIEDLAKELWLTKYSRCNKDCNSKLPKTSSGFKHVILGEETCKNCNNSQCEIENRKEIKYMQGQHQWFTPYIAETEGRLQYYDYYRSHDSWVDLRYGFKWSQSSDEIVRGGSHFQPYNSIAHDMALVTVCALLPSVYSDKKACPFKSRRTEQERWEWYAVSAHLFLNNGESGSSTCLAGAFVLKLDDDQVRKLPEQEIKHSGHGYLLEQEKGKL